MPDAGLTLTQQPPLSPAATVAANAPASVVWHRLATDGLADRIDTAVNSLVGERRPGQRALALEQMGVTALDGLFASAIASLADAAPIRERWQDQARRAIEEFGSAEASALGVHAPLEALADGPLAVLDAADVTPTVVVTLDAEFFDTLRPDQQRDVCALLCDLAAVCAVRVVASGVTQTKLRREYHAHLPVSRTCNGHPSEGTITQRVEVAREALAPDGRKVKILRQLADEPSETLTYHALYAMHSTSRGTISQCLVNDDDSLTDLGLVETFSRSAGNGKAVELLAAGRELLDALDSAIGRQQSLADAVSDPPNPSDEHVCSPEPQSRESAPPDGGCEGDAAQSGWTKARYMSRHDHAAVCGAVEGADIALSDHPVEGAGHSPLFSYDDDREEVVVGAEFHSSLSYLVGVARSLAGPKMWNHVLTPDRLDANADLGALPSPTIWTRCSQGGWCSSGERTATEYIGRLTDALDDILDATSEYRHLRDTGEDEDADETARWIIRNCHGLIGTVTRMLDYCDIDLVRYVQLPEYAADFHTSENHRRRRSILKTITKASSIAGSYGAYTAERTMYEPRPEKREFALGAPDVTAGDSGDFIGSWMIAGRGVSKLIDPADGPGLKSALHSPGELQEDGANFAVFDVPLSIQTDRESKAVRAAVKRMCEHKTMRPTETAMRLFTACVGSVFDATRALNHLGAEPAAMPRPIRLDEVRRALATVPADRLLADTPSRSAGRLLKTMLNATAPLSQTELATQAAVSTQTVRNNTDILEALALIEREGDTAGEAIEWRCSLPTREERGERGSAALNPLRRADDGLAIGPFQRMVEALTECIADSTVRDAYGTAIRDLNTLCERCPALTPWLRLAVSLQGMDLAPSEYGTLLLGTSATTGYGESPSQANLTESAPMGVAD